MAKYAYILNDDTVGMIVEADSLEKAQEVSSLAYGTKEVILVDDKEDANLATPGAGWDGTKFTSVPKSSLDDLHPTNFGPETTVPAESE